MERGCRRIEPVISNAVRNLGVTGEEVDGKRLPPGREVKISPPYGRRNDIGEWSSK